mgnify:CR=1 FL=1
MVNRFFCIIFSNKISYKNKNYNNIAVIETKESGIPTKLALEELNSNPQNTIMIGDAPMDYISAKNAGGNKTILVATGQIEKEELKKTSSYVVNNLSEIKIYT